MAIDLIYIGKSSKNIYSEAECEFTKRIKRYTRFEINQINPLKLSNSLPKDEMLKAEYKLFQCKLKEGSYIILLDETGKAYDSRGFSKHLESLMTTRNNISFVIGGAYGFSDDFKSSSQELISLSKMTLPHHMARLVLLEQIYRAFSIMKNEPYHND